MIFETSSKTSKMQTILMKECNFVNRTTLTKQKGYKFNNQDCYIAEEFCQVVMFIKWRHITKW